MYKIIGHSVDYILPDLEIERTPRSHVGKNSKRPVPKQNRVDIEYHVADDPDTEDGFNEGSVFSAASIKEMLFRGSFTENTILSRGIDKFKITGQSGKRQHITKF